VCDIQGVGNYYTDPQIHSADGESFGAGNCGQDGINAFFQSHKCNNLCRRLGLAPAPSSALSSAVSCLCLVCVFLPLSCRAAPLSSHCLTHVSRVTRVEQRCASDAAARLYSVQNVLCVLHNVLCVLCCLDVLCVLCCLQLLGVLCW